MAGQSMSPGLRKMTARAAAAVPFAAAELIGELAGLDLTGKRAGPRAEADGAAGRRRAAGKRRRRTVPGEVPDMSCYCSASARCHASSSRSRALISSRRVGWPRGGMAQ